MDMDRFIVRGILAKEHNEKSLADSSVGSSRECGEKKLRSPEPDTTAKDPSANTPKKPKIGE